jgi:pimeloyl-ACP methyl ester carboxylesterase
MTVRSHPQRAMLPAAGPALNRRTLLGVGALLGASAASGAQEPSLQAATSAAVSGYAPVDGLRVYYEIHGGTLEPGTAPFVLLHGGMMTIETAFADDLLPRLARLRPVIAIEQQGHGHTADRDAPADLGRMVEDTAGVLAHLGVRQANLVGHSMGGMIATGVAIRHPEVVRSVCAISAGYQLEGFLPELVVMQRDTKHQPSAELIPLLPTEADFAAWRAAYDRSAPDPAAFDRVLAKLNRMLAEWKGWTPDELRAIRAPFMLAIGDNDFIRIEHAAEMVRLIPGAQLAILPGTTHMNIIQRGAWLEPMIQARLA